MAKYPKYYVRPDGLHETILRINGKRKAFRGKTDREVWEKVKAFDRAAAEAEAQQAAKEATTFATLANRWWDEIEPTLEHNSTKNYRPALKRAKDEFGDCQVSEITAQMIDAYIHDFSATRARKTAATQLQIIRQILRFAVVQGALPYNPAEALRLPKGLKVTYRMPPDEDQVKLIKAHAKDTPFGLFAALVYYTGCRRGEALALTGADIDRKAKRISITKSVYYVGNYAQIKQPKTEKGTREVPLLDALDKLLPKRLPKGYLFAEPNGEPLTDDHFFDAYKKYQQATGVTVTPHQIRHGYATALYECGVDFKTMQALLGHAQLSTTMDIYTHVRQNSIKAAEEKMQENF